MSSINHMGTKHVNSPPQQQQQQQQPPLGQQYMMPGAVGGDTLGNTLIVIGLLCACGILLFLLTRWIYNWFAWRIEQHNIQWARDHRYFDKGGPRRGRNRPRRQDDSYSDYNDYSDEGDSGSDEKSPPPTQHRRRRGGRRRGGDDYDR